MCCLAPARLCPRPWCRSWRTCSQGAAANERTNGCLLGAWGRQSTTYILSSARFCEAPAYVTEHPGCAHSQRAMPLAKSITVMERQIKRVTHELRREHNVCTSVTCHMHYNVHTIVFLCSRHVIEYMTLQEGTCSFARGSDNPNNGSAKDDYGGLRRPTAGGPPAAAPHGAPASGSLLSLFTGSSVGRMASLATWHPGVTVLFAGAWGGGGFAAARTKAAAKGRTRPT
jgi:hypothetical protein